jgi:ribosomal protein S18 acetylase RimI-like enzyme
MPIVVDLDDEAFSPYGTVEGIEVFRARLQSFPAGFIVLEVDGEIAAYACSEKWLCEREPKLNENSKDTHHPNGKIFFITGMAVSVTYRGKGYGLALLDRLTAIARQENCDKIVLETTHAQGFYLKRGFKVTGTRQERGVALNVMVLEL